MKKYFFYILAICFVASTGYSFQFIGGSVSGGAGAWHDDWGRKVVLTISNTNVDSDLTDYPVLITADTMPAEAFDTDHADYAANGAQADCGDIRIFNGDYSASNPATVDTNAISYEVVNCEHDATTPIIEIWAKVPTVTSASSTDITVYYNASGKSQYGTESDTWDANFEVVYHFNEDPTGGSGAVLDSTSNGRNATASGTWESNDLSTGGIGYAIEFEDDASEYLTIDNTAWTGITGSTARTISVYFADTSANASDESIIGWGTDSSGQKWLFRIDDTNDYPRTECSGGKKIGNTAYGTGYRHWVSVFDGATPDLDDTLHYVNATEQGTYSGTGLTTTINTVADANATIGYHASQSGSYLEAYMSELRVSSTNRSAAWIKADYNFWSAPASNITEGAPSAP